MPTSRRETIMAAVLTRFQGITVANGYNTNLGTYAALWDTATKMPEGQTLALSIEDRTERPEQAKSGIHMHTIGVVCAFAAISSTPAVTARSIVADITNAIRTDRTWGGVAFETIPGPNEFDVFHMDKLLVVGEVSFEIQYRTTSWNPYQAQP